MQNKLEVKPNRKKYSEYLQTIKYEIADFEYSRIPKNGPLILVVNRPVGWVEELIIYKMIIRIREDIVFINNDHLQYMIELSTKHFIEKDKFDIYEVLAKGSCLVLFPVGGISYFKSKKNGFIDSEWNNSLIKFIFKSHIQVLPINISISNNDLSGFIHIIHNKDLNIDIILKAITYSNIIFKIRVSKPIITDKWHFNNANQFGRFIRARIYALESKINIDLFFNSQQQEPNNIINSIDPNVIDNELEALYDTNCIFEQYQFRLYLCKAKKMPNTINEIGRLREITFRAVGEGTLKTLDLDEYDLHYIHLFLYDFRSKKIVGAYRLGHGTYIMNTLGRKGFYTSSLFRIKKEFNLILEDSLELGRSFIVQEYQNQRLPLFLLWKGISYYLKKNHNIKYIIGPVSISKTYSNASKKLIVDFITKYYSDKFLSQFIHARNLFTYESDMIDSEILIDSTGNSIKSLEDIIDDIDPVHNRIPVLIKKYIAQNAKILAFNIDSHFNNALDGFMLLDIRDLSQDMKDTFENNKVIDFE